MVAAPVSMAATFSYTTFFDATFDSTLSAPTVGGGILTYDAPSQLPDGTYPWTSFTGLTVSLTLGGTTFTDADLDTSPAQVEITLANSGFYFRNDTPPVGFGDGFFNGSADFISGAFALSTEPYLTTAFGPTTGGGIDTPLYFAATSDGNLSGTYGVPESSTWIALNSMIFAAGHTFFRQRHRGL